MASSNLNITAVAAGQNNKEVTINDADLALENATQRVLAIDMSSGDVSLTVAQITRNGIFVCSGLTANQQLEIPQDVGAGANTAQRLFTVVNNSEYVITVIGDTSGTGVAVGKNRAVQLYGDGDEIFVAGTGTGTNGITIGAFIPGETATSATLIRYEVVSDFVLPAGLAESVGHVLVAPSGGAVSLSVAKNGVNIGSMDFADGNNDATFSLASDNSFTAGDYFTVSSPSDTFAMSGLSFTFRGEP